MLPKFETPRDVKEKTAMLCQATLQGEAAI